MSGADEMSLTVDPRGDVRCVYGEAIDLCAIGPVAVTRVSHVEPDAAGRWWADLGPVAGPALGPFARRTEALGAERRWLDEHWLYARHPPSAAPRPPHPRPERPEGKERRGSTKPMRGITIVLIVAVLLLMFIGCLDQFSAAASPRGPAAGPSHPSHNTGRAGKGGP